jgi:hypothetical protein
MHDTQLGTAHSHGNRLSVPPAFCPEQGLKQLESDALSSRELSDVDGMLGDAGVCASVGHGGSGHPAEHRSAFTAT